MRIYAKKDMVRYRLIAGFSIEELAQKAGVNQATISYIENQKRSPSPATAKKICEALGQPFNILFEIKEE